ncbi:unnamed protein product, partial [Sphenostylis stenocarpa]
MGHGSEEMRIAWAIIYTKSRIYVFWLSSHRKYKKLRKWEDGDGACQPRKHAVSSSATVEVQ